MTKKVAIIGSGVGGLALAARLANKGLDVNVFEKLASCGGRNNIIEDKGFKFDTGPSFVLMPDLFAELFNYCGEDIKRHLDLKQLDVNYKIFYPDKKALTVYKDVSRKKDELERFERGASLGYDHFIEETERIYKRLRPHFYKCFSLRDAFNPRYLSMVSRIRPLQTYWNLACKYFKTEALRYAFTFEAMFMGVSPFRAPAFYSIIAYTDHSQNIAHPIGGMYRIPKVIEGLASRFGAKFNYNQPVRKIEHRAGGKKTLFFENGDFQADILAVNADYSYTQEVLLKRKLPEMDYSCSVYLIYLGLKKKIKGLEHHNLFFADDLRKNLAEIFDNSIVPLDPSFYVHVPTLTDASLAPVGKEIVYILIPVPNLKSPKTDFRSKEDQIRKTIFRKIEEVIGESLENLIEAEHRFYPEDFIKRYNINYGATFGLAHTLFQSAFFRPCNYDSQVNDLYYVGASSQPGGGLPIVIAGSRIVADLIEKA